MSTTKTAVRADPAVFRVDHRLTGGYSALTEGFATIRPGIPFMCVLVTRFRAEGGLTRDYF